ncbi:hypothetical protein [Streptomyces sp. NPDC048481]|uniref:hypothetical protein n=1 Tax=Streptomyces sp. NPDC048481 TaxID=3365557 RepID=UPI00371386FE
MPRPRRAAGAALLAAAVLAVGGCGSDTEPSKDAEPWASAVYYSEGATEDGAVGDYTGKVRQISLSTGADDPGASGQLTC